MKNRSPPEPTPECRIFWKPINNKESTNPSHEFTQFQAPSSEKSMEFNLHPLLYSNVSNLNVGWQTQSPLQSPMLRKHQVNKMMDHLGSASLLKRYLMLMPTTTLSIYSLFKPWKEFQATEKRINAKYALQREWMKTDETKVATDALSLLENVAPKLMTG